MTVLKKGIEPTKKKKNKQIVFKNKIETSVPNKHKFFWWDPKFYFTSMKIVLQKCIPNKLLVSTYFQNYQNESSFYQRKKGENSFLLLLLLLL